MAREEVCLIHSESQLFNIHLFIRLKGQMKTQLSQRPFSSKEVHNILLEPHHLKNLQPTECKTLQGILHEIGGTGIFVFLFARVRITDCNFI